MKYLDIICKTLIFPLTYLTQSITQNWKGGFDKGLLFVVVSVVQHGR